MFHILCDFSVNLIQMYPYLYTRLVNILLRTTQTLKKYSSPVSSYTCNWRRTADTTIVLVCWFGTLNPVFRPWRSPTSIYLKTMNPLDLITPNTTGYKKYPGLSELMVSKPDNTKPEIKVIVFFTLKTNYKNCWKLNFTRK